jgi:hypothetical protein
MRLCAILAAFTFVSFAAAEDKPAVRTLVTKDVKFDYSKAGSQAKPAEIKSADDLAKSALFTDDNSREAINKQVNFSKEKLVVFTWGGSGGDTLTGALLKDDKATFTYTAGVTDDLRYHGLAFAVPKDAAVEVKK